MLRRIRQMGDSIDARMNRLSQNEVAEKVSTAAVAFVLGLFTWMTNTYTALVAEQGIDSGVEVWQYITHAVQNIFRELHDIRHYGSGEEPSVQAWYSLKAYTLQKDLLDKEFTNHDIVLKVLHQHLKHNVVTKAEYEQDITHLRKELSTQQVRIQKLESKAGKT